MNKELSIVLKTGADYGIDEALPIYTSKIDVKDWIGLKYTYDNADGCNHLIGPEKTRSILREYKRALLVIGKSQERFKEAILAIEKELKASGFYKAFSLINGPCEFCSGIDLNPEISRRPSLDLMGIDILATVRRFKKNEPSSEEGESKPYSIILVE